MNDRDHDLFEDMRDYSREAISIVGDLDAAGLLADRLRFLAACRAVEIVGEAASRVSAEGRADLPGFAWRDAINMRNVLIHNYGRIQAEVVVATVRSDLPRLVVQLEQVLGPTP